MNWITADLDDFAFLELPARPTPVISSIFDWQRNPAFPFTNGGFESSLSGWSNAGDNSMSSAASSAARTGTLGLRVTDTSATAGSSLKSATFPVAEGYNYQVNFSARLISGAGIGIYLYFKDANNADLPTVYHFGVPGNATSWTSFSFQGRAPAGAVAAYIWIHSYSASIVTAELDDFAFRAVWD